MSEQTAKEQFYDEQIAPELARLAFLCQEKGLSFCAVVEFDPASYGRGRTAALAPDSSWAIQMVNHLAKVVPNIDAFFMALTRDATERGHSSIYLQQLGIPADPQAGDPQ
jgi:hypothetical protein